jgi:hypothetical protein
MLYPPPANTIRHWDVRPLSVTGHRAASGGANTTTQIDPLGDPLALEYESSDPSVASVSATGLVTWGMKAGRATIAVSETANPGYLRYVTVAVTAIPGDDIQDVGTANDPGNSDRYARENHVHAGMTELEVPPVLVLPPIPASGCQMVFWQSSTTATGGTGDDQVWMAYAGQLEWTPSQIYTDKNGTP